MKCPVFNLFILIFLCNENEVMCKDADSKIYLEIPIEKSNKSIDTQVVRGGNIYVKFIADYHIHEAGLGEENKTLPGGVGIRWAPDNTTLPVLEIDTNHKKIFLDFGGPMSEKHMKLNLFVLSNKGNCVDADGKPKSSPMCTYKLNGAYYIIHNYTVIFTATDYLKVTANGNQLEVYSIEGDIPSNLVFLYELKYRPGDYNISFTYLGEEDVTAKWIRNGLDLNTKSVSRIKSLVNDDDGKTISCTFTKAKKDEAKINMTAFIMFKYVSVGDLLNVQVNDKILENPTRSEGDGDLYVIYYKNGNFNITCSPSNTEVCKKENCNMMLCIPSLASNGNSVSCTSGGSKPTSKNITLTEEDDGALVNCSYTSDVYGGIETSVGVRFVLIKEIKLEVNDERVTDGSTFEYDEDTVPVVCSASMPDALNLSPDIELKLYQNEYMILVANSSTNGGITTATLKTIVTLKDGDTLRCLFTEKLHGHYTPDIYAEVNITTKKTKPTPTTVLPNTAPVTTGDDHITDNPDHSKVSGGPISEIFSDNWYIYAIILCAGIVIIVIIVCIVKVSRNKPRDAEELVPAEYATLNDTPPPPNFPHNATLEETYCRPADTKNSEPTYAQPYIPKSPEELYSKPVPKHARKNPGNDKLYASLEFENAYAKVKPKNQRSDQFEEPGYAEVGKFNDEPSYASVQQYANMNNSNNQEDYYNVFDNSSYANSKRNAEYVEPSYCEVSKVRK